MQQVLSDPGRVVKAISLGKPQTPALVLSLAMQAARTSGATLPDILKDCDAFADAQLAMHERWQHDLALAMFYAAIEAEAFGSQTCFFDNGPPNAGAPVVRAPADIGRLDPRAALESSGLARTLDLIRQMKKGLDGRALVGAVCIGPLSGPVMLLGMERWLDMLTADPSLAHKLVDIYAEFSLEWGRQQIQAGADSLIWFEPFASTELLPASLINELALPTLSLACDLGVPVCLHLASARAQGIADAAADTGISLLSVGRFDDVEKLHGVVNERVALLGNMDGVSMAQWDVADVGRRLEGTLNFARTHTGFIVSDVHGEIPYQVDPEIIDKTVTVMRNG